MTCQSTKLQQLKFLLGKTEKDRSNETLATGNALREEEEQVKRATTQPRRRSAAESVASRLERTVLDMAATIGPTDTAASKVDRLKTVLARTSVRPPAVAGTRATQDEQAAYQRFVVPEQGLREMTTMAGVRPESSPSEKLVRLKTILSSTTPASPERPMAQNVTAKRTTESPTSQDSRGSTTRRRRKIHWGRLPAEEPRQRVVVVGVEPRKNKVYVQQASAQRDIIDMMKSLNEIILKEGKKLDWSSFQSDVAVLREQDSTWYRGRIFEDSDDLRKTSGDCPQGGYTVKVLYVDYGNWDTVSREQIRELPEVFLDRRPFAVPLILHGVPRLYDEAALPLQNQVFEAEVVADDRRRQEVRLYTIEDGVCLNDVLKVLEP